ncbi:hypothetical protein [Stenotrophomonas sp. SORGH_AS_0321]|uniref:hypothetical protein n=1 Tax=Stenotrophomonas sp. SORGH_AS_0321 TaxID=3041787 RepID=UPI00286C980C|nr:hypothetical protein [Stenotrophomonas sp. SORGH_AS_0321]
MNDIPDEQWGVIGGGHFKTFGLQDFLERSEGTMPELLAFDSWGVGQPRSYRAEIPEMLNDAAPIVMVVWPSI